MKKYFSTFQILIVANIFFLQVPTTFSQANKLNNIERGTLSIKISGFENDKGDCWFALDNSKDVYESKDSVFIGKILTIINRGVQLRIDSLEYGYYAIKVFHDENCNGILDLNFLGIPTEDYGYSNNVSGWFGPPKWEKTRFLFNKSEMTIEISVD
ncbi:MAG: DUF2141 domain-containing protein [Ignavibacteriales bacterium]|nr:DUF2141 domain-containing protein [Ignavibacteriales bacterium]